jgi:hypothetical protein
MGVLDNDLLLSRRVGTGVFDTWSTAASEEQVREVVRTTRTEAVPGPFALKANINIPRA